MSDFENWLKNNLAISAFAAEQLRLRAEQLRQEEFRPTLRLELPPCEPDRSSSEEGAE